MNTIRKNQISNENGNILLLTLLIMASLLGAAVSLGSLVINESRQSKAIDYSIVAFYAAESSIERSVYDIRKAGATIDGINAEGELDNGASYSMDAVGSESEIYGSIKKNQSLQLDLYDPDNHSWQSGIGSVKIEWSDSCSGCSWIDLSLIQWTPGDLIDYENKEYEFQYSGGSAINNSAVATDVYRMKVKALYGDISNLRIRAYSGDDATGDQIDIPARAVMNARGTFRSTSQAIRVTMPRKLPLLGLFDYVLFSECSLVKRDVSVCP